MIQNGLDPEETRTKLGVGSLTWHLAVEGMLALARVMPICKLR
jgi:hypothetical protein